MDNLNFRTGGGALNRGLIGQEDAVVDYAGEDAAEQGADPVNPVVGPVIARNERRAEGAGGIYGGAGEGKAAEGVHGDGEADGEACYFVEGTFGVNGGGEENEDEEERHHAFEEHAVQAREIRRERGSDGAESFGAPAGIGDDDDERIGGGDGAEKLRDPIEQSLHGAETAADPEADGDGGIQMAAGNVSHGGDHDADGEAVGEGEAEDGDAALTGGAEILVGAEGAGGEEDDGESAEEFREQFLGEAVQAALPGKTRRDASEAVVIAPRAILLN